MKKLWLLLLVVMAFASCDEFTEEEFCPIGLDTISAGRNSIVMTVIVNESYLQLNYCEFGAVCTISPTPPSGDAGISAIKTPLGRKGVYQLEFSGSFPESRYYVHLYTASHESGKARYHDCVEVVMDGVSTPTEDDWYLSGEFNDWITRDKNYKMTYEDGWFGFEGLVVPELCNLKLVLGEWKQSLGYETSMNVDGDPFKTGGMYDIRLPERGVYDVYLSADASQGRVVKTSGNAPVEDWYLVGAFNVWVTGDQNYKMELDGFWYVYKGLEVTSEGDIKFVGEDWDRNLGYESEMFVDGTPFGTDPDGNDIRLPEAGTYDVYLSYDTFKARIVQQAWGLSGSHNGWSDVDTPMLKEGDRYVARGVEFNRSDNQFKVRLNNSWSNAWGLQDESIVLTDGSVVKLSTDSNNIRIEDGTYDLWLDPKQMTLSVSLIATALDPLNCVSLDSNGSSNCYIVSESGAYKFRSVQGNSGTSVGDVSKVEVLWESFGTDVAPNVGDLIKSVSYKDGYIAFETNSSFKEGNAVIAAKDAYDTILWSWHIWLTDQPEEQVYYNNAGTMMDRNLGATSATPGDVGALGLLYQWGRKDPFLGSSSISESIVAESTISWPSAVSSDSNNGTIEYAVSHPLTFITRNTKNDDWYYTGSSSTDDTRWTTSSCAKSIYDPCPVGWRVPDGGDNGVWMNAYESTTFGIDYDSGNQGINFTGKLGSNLSIWYPATGWRYHDDGKLYNVADHGIYWSVTHNNEYTYSFTIQASGLADNNGFGSHVSGCSVRCIKEGSGGGTSEPEGTAVDLSESVTANSYIVSKNGNYKFRSVQGNSETSVEDVSKVEVLWESFGTDVAPNVGDLIKSVSYKNGEITFQTADTFKEGNAVIAAKDASGTILWSWHIWLTDQPEEQVYYNNAGTMMDRNLGATSATLGDVGALGLLYQWGRKDPFLGSSSISESVEAESTISWPSAVESDASNGTISYATQHPTTFICGNFYNGDWYYTGSYTTDNTCWQSLKTIYDPCPAGWRVPDGGENGVWAKALGSSSWYVGTYDESNEGMDFSNKFASGQIVWYPASGYCNRDSGVLQYVGGRGFYWSCTPYNSTGACGFRFAGTTVDPVANGNHALGIAVRCMKE